MLTNWLRSLFSKRMAQSLARHVMTVVAGWLTALHLPTEVIIAFRESGNEVVTALILAGVAMLWSVLDKKNDE